MLIDSHLHLPENFEEARLIIERAKAAGVVKFINIGTSLADSQKALETAEKFSEVYSTAAVYPHEDMGLSIDQIESGLRKVLGSSKKIVGVGECGIDISNWENGRSVDDQLKVFEMQIALAGEFNLPLVIHNRNGDEIVLNALKNSQISDLTGVMHCFASTWEIAKKFLDLGFYISFSGMITYPSRKDLLETVEKVPKDRFLLETDSPYLPPQGHRGEKNEPQYVRIVALKVAEVRKTSVDTIEKLSYTNTSRLFKI